MQTETTMLNFWILGKEFINFSKPLKFQTWLERLPRPLSFQGISLYYNLTSYTLNILCCCIAMKILHTSGLKGHRQVSVILLFSKEMGLTSSMAIPLPRSRASNSWLFWQYLEVWRSGFCQDKPDEAGMQNWKLDVQAGHKTKQKSKYLGNKSKQKK